MSRAFSHLLFAPRSLITSVDPKADLHQIDLPAEPNPEHPADTFPFIVVANRLPVDIVTQPDGQQTLSPSPGGLVTALSPVLQEHHGCWVGWPGEVDVELEPFLTEGGVTLHPITLDHTDYEGFYEGFSNATLWPLYHDLIVQPVFDPEWWEVYREVNDRFARKVAELAAPNATVWVQDYQLQLVPGILRLLRPDLRIGFFLHIPFPAPDIYRQLPWREEILRGLLGADLIGFHLLGNTVNFLHLAAAITGENSHTGLPALEIHGEAGIRQATATIDAPDGRRVGVGAFPISIAIPAKETPRADLSALRSQLGDPEIIFLGVDRLDYTKGILQRLLAFEELLESGALDPEGTVLLQIATPSRERIEQYRTARTRVEEAVGRINGRFGRIGHPVVHYQHSSVPHELLNQYYQLADIMLVTPYKDGMNLVAKEFVAAHPEGDGALVLSEFAGAADELTQAHLCNPYDLDSIKRRMIDAVTELRLYPERAHTRMNALSQQVREHDVHLWANSFLSCLEDTAGDREA